MISNKIDKNLIPKKEKKIKRHIIHRKKALKTKKVTIESVLISEEFYIEKDKKLSGKHREFLKKIAKIALTNSSVYVKIEAENLNYTKRKYILQIKKYLKNRGLKSSQIKIVQERSKKKQNIVKSYKKDNFLELLLIERI